MKKPGKELNPTGFYYYKMAATYSPTRSCSTIGAIGLNFSVRNGKRWIPNAITALISKKDMMDKKQKRVIQIKRNQKKSIIKTLT